MSLWLTQTAVVAILVVSGTAFYRPVLCLTDGYLTIQVIIAFQFRNTILFRFQTSIIEIVSYFTSNYI